MPRLLKRLLAFLWVSIATAIILAAVLTVAARQLLPMVPAYRTRIESFASRWLHHPVKIGRIQVGWHWLDPTLTLDNIRVLDKVGHPPLKLAQVKLRLGLWNSIMALQPVPSLISLNGSRVSITRKQGNRFSLTGITLPLPTGQSISGPGMAAHIPGWVTRVTYRLHDIHVLINDEPNGQTYRFSGINVTAYPTRGGLDLKGRVTLPHSLGQQIQFAARVQRQGSGAATAWSARTYTEFKNIRLAGLPLKQVRPGLSGMQARVSARIWSVWSKNRLESVSGHVGIHGLSLGTHLRSADQSSAASGLTDMSGDLRWQSTAQGWQLRGTQLKLSAGSKAWPVDQLALDYSHIDGKRQINGWIPFLRIQNLTPLLSQMPGLPDVLTRHLAVSAPSGVIRDLRFEVQQKADASPALTMSTDLNNVSMHKDGELPGFKGLTGQLAMNPSVGSITIHSTGLVMNIPQYFSRALPPIGIHGRLNWRRREAGYQVIAPHVSFKNPDLDVDGELGLWLPTGGQPYLNLMLGIQRASVKTIPRYLPDKLLHANLIHWMHQSLQGGTLTHSALILRGYPSDFPFRKHQGIFEADFNLQSGVINYFHGWPWLKQVKGLVKLRNDTLSADITQAHVLATQVSRADVKIPDLTHAVLNVTGVGTGPLANIVTYLSLTPLGHGRQSLFKEMHAGGQTRFKMKLRLPLVGPARSQWTLKGDMGIDNGSFAMPNQGFNLKRINGTLAFTRRSLNARGIKAEFRGAPVILGASTRHNGLATLTLEGHLSAAQLLGAHSTMLHYIKGATNWHVNFSFPMTQDDYRRYGFGLTVTSGLRGLAVDLPAPLGKPADSGRELSVHMPLSQAKAPILLRYGSRLQALVALSGQGSCRHIARADIRFNHGTPRLPAQGISIEGHLDKLNIQAWQTLIGQLKPGSPSSSRECPGGSRSMLDNLRHVNLSFGQLSLFGNQMHHASIKASRQGKLWTADLSSSLIDGKVKIPVDLHGKTPLRFDLSKLILNHLDDLESKAKSFKQINPALLPSLSGHVGKLVLEGHELHNLTVEAKTSPKGMHIPKLSIDQSHLQLDAQGAWLHQTNGHTRMQVAFTIQSNDLGKAMESLNVPVGIAGGKGNLSGDLSWPGGPAQLSWKNLQGSAWVNFKDGRLKKVNPGQAGRILGLFNLSALPQRLTLHFGDVFGKGFAFNDLNGHFRIHDGNIVTKDAHMDSNSVNLKINGRIGMLAKDYNADIIIVPQVQSTLTIAGAVLGGPATGAVLYFLDRFLGIGKQLNRVVEFHYHVSGSWNAPKVKPENEAAKRQLSKPRPPHKPPLINPF